MQEKPLLAVEVSDETLIERVKGQDMAAFTLLYDRYAPAIYALAAHLLGPTDADEVVQEVFLRLWNKAEQFNGQAGLFKSWFMTIARNYIWDLLKRRTHEQQLLATYEIEQRLSDPIDPVHHIAEEAWMQQQQAVLLNALHDLPPEQRRAIVMAYFGGFSQSAIAQELGWPLGIVKKDWVFGTHRHFGAEAPAAVENSINVVDYAFSSPTITVTAGTTVTWASKDVVMHTVTAKDFSFGSGALRPQASFRHVFAEAGIYEYLCAIHPTMQGTVVVTEE